MQVQPDRDLRIRLYRIWTLMRSRCNYEGASYFANYGGKGIKVSVEWDDYINFYEWSISNGYTDLLTLDRIDESKDYGPSNCRWVNWSTQAANKPKRKGAKFPYIGVRPIHGGKWRAVINVEQKQLQIGCFSTEADAVKARNDYIDQHNLPHRKN